ncbi:hypothetical protein [Arthrobacter sp. B1805]|uniref:hypothetical protein n=1 Tax=Arthrobacter sp. B1805 TaxID=2058892 RepID=UPI000CE56907|nr:hypothetical protein [Arthrobacter sp. B1805]
MQLKQLAASGVLAIAVVGLSACGGADYGIAALERDATSEDQLPAFVSDEGVDVESIRKVAEQDGVSYFIGTWEDREGFCVYSVVVDDFTGGCGTGSENVVTVSPAPGSDLPHMTLVTDSYSDDDLERDGWSQVHENIMIR